MWMLAIRFFISSALFTFVAGARVMKWMLIVEAVGFLVFVVWMTAICFGEKGVGVVALLAIVRWIFAIGPIIGGSALGAVAGWGARRAAGISATTTIFNFQRGRRGT